MSAERRRHTAQGDACRPPTRMQAARRVLDLDRYAPYALTLLSATLSARASALYRAEFGVGVTGWRVLVSLSQEPGIAASQIVSAIVLDKAAVSRALAGLEQQGLVEAVAQDRDPRRKAWFLTETGWRLHDEMLAHALAQEALLTKGIPEQELMSCLSVLRRMQDNLTAAQDPASAR